MRHVTDDELMTFAALRWPKRFNAVNPDSAVPYLDEVGNSLFLVTCPGFVYFDREEDGPHLLRQLKAAVKLLEDNL